MNILYILGAYKPRASANGICSDNVIQQLLSEGHSVTALVNAAPGEPNYSVTGNFTIKRVKQRWSLRVDNLSDAFSKAKPLYSALLKKIAILINKVQLFFMAPFWPVVSPITVFRFRQAALSLHKTHCFDAVISVYTPIEALLAGYAVKKKYPEIKYIPYYLDALAGGWGPKKWSVVKIERHTRRIEKKIAEKADLIVSMNSSKEYHLQNPLDTEKQINRCFLDVPTLIIPKEEIQIKDVPYTGYELLYSGYINYPHRNPLPLLEVMSRLCNLMDITVTFAGTCNKPKLFQPYIQKTNGKIRYLGQQTHDEIITLAKQADLFLNIGSTNPFTIACKIFEYMLFQKPIITTYSIDNEPCIPYLKKYGLYYLIDERLKDYDSIARELQHYIENIHKSDEQHESLERLFYDNTPQAFTSCIAKLVEDKQ